MKDAGDCTLDPGRSMDTGRMLDHRSRGRAELYTYDMLENGQMMDPGDWKYTGLWRQNGCRIIEAGWMVRLSGRMYATQ